MLSLFFGAELITLTPGLLLKLEVSFHLALFVFTKVVHYLARAEFSGGQVYNYLS